MTDHVEARSLAALNQLAANPPQYPKKPTEAKQDSLTLYISRVPGTRDIILSTLKPQIKNVTAEDVASSLYYVHLQTPEDEPLAPPNGPWHSPSPRSSDESSRPKIQRKPLPAQAGKAASVSIASSVPPVKEYHDNGVPMRKPVPDMARGEHQVPTMTVMPPSTPDYRMPLGPKPFTTDKNQANIPPLPGAPRPTYHETTHVKEQAPPLPIRPGNRLPQSDTSDASCLTSDLATSPRASSLSTKKRPFVPFSLTLIRRDPSSGQQWNVGKIASFQLENPELMEDEKHQQHSPSIQIHLETSGYAKFRGMPSGSDIALGGSVDLRPSSSSSAATTQLHGASTSVPLSGAFERQVRMTYSPSFTASIKQRFRSGSLVDEGRPTSPMKRLGHKRDGSHTSVGSFGGDFDGGDAPVITQPAPGLKPRGYMFFSPWNGRCEFVTGKAGRSLRCRHRLPSYGGGVYNPLVNGTDAEHGDEKADNVQTVSELRFNLPSHELLADKKSAEGGMRTRDHLQSQFNKMVAKAQGLEDSDDEDFGFDMSLGREKAGGGNRGKRAKMGKLIVLDEGLKMLDLTVAANVGIWWTTWERTY